MIRLTKRGQALVEFALVIPLFLVLVLGAVDFGRGIFSYAVLSNGAREGARYAIVHGSLAQSLDGLCGSGPGTGSTTSDSLGALVIEATGASAPGWAPPPSGCAAPITVAPVGLDLTKYSASVCWGDGCTVPPDCSGAGTNTSPSNVPDVPVTVRTCYRFQVIAASVLGIGPIVLAADATLSITH